jgi:hypothetical protein
MSVESVVAGIKAQVDAHGRDLRDIWDLLRKAQSVEAKQDLVLYRLDEMKAALAAHDSVEVEHRASHEGRLIVLENTMSAQIAERKGAWRVVAMQGAAVGALISGALTAAVQHFLAMTK